MNYADIYDIVEQYSEAGAVTNNFLSYALGILLIVARWFIFVKAGEEGWASIIPFYNRYVLYKVSDKKKLFLPWLLCGIACYVSLIGFIISVVFVAMDEFKGLSSESGAIVALVICLCIMLGTAIADFVFYILQNIGLAGQFGLSGGWAAGLIFLPHIFYSIIGFSKKYQHINSQAKSPYENPYAQPQSPYENPYAQPQAPGVQPQSPYENPYAQPQAPVYPPTMDYGQPTGADATEDNQSEDNQ